MNLPTINELFWMIPLAIGTCFVVDAGIENKFVTLLVGLIFWGLTVLFYAVIRESK